MSPSPPPHPDPNLLSYAPPNRTSQLARTGWRLIRLIALLAAALLALSLLVFTTKLISSYSTK
jgi:hypothetical protein